MPATIGEFDGHVLVLEDGTSLPLRYVVDAREQVVELEGRSVSIVGAAVPAESTEFEGTLALGSVDAVPTTFHTSWVIEMKSLDANRG